MKKNVLYIKNNYQSKNLNNLDNFFDINFSWINSSDLIGKDNYYLKELVNKYDIIIIGGGPQHITSNYFNTDTYPEIINQIELVKLVVGSNKMLVGICLGCQIIGKTFGYNIIQMNKLCVGFNYLDTNSIDYNLIKSIDDKFLSKLDFELLSKSFSFHYDCVCMDFINLSDKLNQELYCIGKSILNIPYIIKHSKSNIYGFQSHPEVTIECITNVLKYLQIQKNISDVDIPNINKFNSEIYFHFFDIFINS